MPGPAPLVTASAAPASSAATSSNASLDEDAEFVLLFDDRTRRCSCGPTAWSARLRRSRPTFATKPSTRLGDRRRGAVVNAVGILVESGKQRFDSTRK